MSPNQYGIVEKYLLSLYTEWPSYNVESGPRNECQHSKILWSLMPGRPRQWSI